MAKKRTIALIIPAYNEALVLKNTINSALNAGIAKRDIFVVIDKSTDNSAKIAKRLVYKNHVLVLRKRSGKGLAIAKAAAKFKLPASYRWIHIADADGQFESGYFNVLRKHLRVKYAAATGYIKSLPSSKAGQAVNPVAQFRVYEYTLGMEIHRRFQALTNLVAVLPGPTSCFRSDVFEKLKFNNGSLTEDFDVTLQIHRLKLGAIQFIPEAVVYTQDPKSFADFYQQINRWNRGIFQTMRRHKIGFLRQMIDSYLLYQVLQNLSLVCIYGLILPLFALWIGNINMIAVAFLADLTLIFGVTLAVAWISRRYDIISAFPFIYFYRLVLLFVVCKSFVEVVLLGRFKDGIAYWETANRRYVS